MKPHKIVHKEAIYLIGIALLPIVVDLFGINWLGPGSGEAVDIQWHDTYIVFAKLHFYIFLFMVFGTLLYCFRSLLTVFKSKVINRILFLFLFGWLCVVVWIGFMFWQS